jgi:glycosyltransferase involved in cell wall biosynthesis/tetratricopeptide (TPR) repeat protein
MTQITLGVLARDAGRTLRACLESAAPHVDRIIVGLGGPSSDDTEAIAREFTDEVIPIEWKDDFALARMEVLGRVGTEWFLWLDADDILINGEYMRAAIVANPQANCFTMPYHYDADEYGNLSCTLVRERLVRWPQEWLWQGSVHEVLTLPPPAKWEPVYLPDIVVRHNPERNRDKGTRNLDLLYKELERTEPEPPLRLLFYLGRENAARGNLREALLHFNRYIRMADNNDEAAQVAFMVVDVLRAVGRPDDAAKAALAAIKIAPTWPDAYNLLGRIAYEQRRFEEAIEWFRTGSLREPPTTGLIVDPRAYTYWPAYYLGLAYAQLGDHEAALENLRNAASLVPDEQIVALIANEQRAVEADRVLSAFMLQYEHLARHDEWLKVRELFRVAPKAIETHPAVVAAQMRTLQQTAHVDHPQVMVDFYRSNPGWAPMSDEHLLSPEWQSHPRLAFARQSITCDPPATILDLGSSDGFISLPLAKDGHIVEGFDLDPRPIEIANRRAREWGLRASYKVGSLENVEGKYDVALAFEILEHVVDPSAFLDKLDEHARKVVITTPFLAWEDGEVADWQKIEPKGHLRIFDLRDMEARITGRGRIFDLQRVPFGPRSAWIFASYRPRQTHVGTVTFLAPGTIEAWSPRKLQHEGLGGSETALIRLAEELFLEGELRCTTYGRIDEPGYYSGVQYRQVEEFEPRVKQDAIVAWRYPEAADLPLRTDRLILWCHDMAYGDRLTPVRAARFDQIVVMTEWHKGYMLDQYPFLDPEKLIVIGNGVDKERFAYRRKGENLRREPHRVAYTSSPDRGLDFVLEKIWPKVVEQVPDAELHVYYGWNNWDALGAARPELQAYRQRVNNLMLQTTGVVQHGRVAQDRLAEDLQRASVWLYPSRLPQMPPWNGGPWYETYCIAAVEAQLAGAIPVTTDEAALAETVRGGIVIPAYMRDDASGQYVEAVVGILTADGKVLANERRQVRRSAPARSWREVASEWLRLVGASNS